MRVRTVADGVILVADPDKEAVQALVLALDEQARKDNAVMRVHGRVGDPVLLRLDAGRVDLCQ